MSTALYRRYRPESFADVIGQDHVTVPLMAALRKNRVNHAYLFSGPRGCGKTTSARILARCLNCAQGPTDTPCGVCDSCIELARDGSGSLDVIEIDAASHGGVDDARDLRERATFAPVRDRYKVFIIDEAHMVTSAGFNALLKIVEEPPEHIKFIFATTEPDKVIGTIRSRTHHYPFRLVPPEPLLAYLEQMCEQEKVDVAPGVLSLVIRAGGGSVRDTLSVLDQLMAGAGPEGLSYDMAIDLLGYTHASLLDDVVDALSADDAAGVFGAADRVIQTGHDPRRFVEDLLERFRDLIIVSAMEDSARHVLRSIPEAQLARMQVQARQLGRAELSRSADIANAALNEMTGATSPRLHLELLCARLLLPGADTGERGVAARVDRIERRLNYAADDGAPPSRSNTSSEQVPEPAPAPAVDTEDDGLPESQSAPDVIDSEDAELSSAASGPIDTDKLPTPPPSRQPGHAAVEQDEPADAGDKREGADADHASDVAGDAAAPATGDVEMVRRAWPEVLEALNRHKKIAWILVSQNGTVRALTSDTLYLEFTTSGIASQFSKHEEFLREALKEVIGLEVRIKAVHPGEAVPDGSGAPSTPDPAQRPSVGRSTEHEAGSAPESAGGGQAEPEPRPESQPEAEPQSNGESGANARRQATSIADPAAGQAGESAGPSHTTGNPRERIWSPDEAQAQQPAARPRPKRSPNGDSTASAQRALASDEPPARPAPRPSADAVPGADSAPRGNAPTDSASSGGGAATDEPPVDDPWIDVPPPDEPMPADEDEPELDRPARTRPTPDDTEAAPPPNQSTPAAAGRAARAPAPEKPESPIEDIPSDDDVELEDSGKAGRAAVERVLGGQLIDERELLRE